MHFNKIEGGIKMEDNNQVDITDIELFTQVEVAGILGKSEKTIQRWSKNDPDKLLDHGYIRLDTGKYVKADTDVGNINNKVNARQKIEMRKLEADARIKEADAKIKALKLEQNQKMLFMAWSDKYSEVFLDCFAPLKTSLTDFKLDDKQADAWNKLVQDCCDTFAKKTATIYQDVEV